MVVGARRSCLWGPFVVVGSWDGEPVRGWSPPFGVGHDPVVVLVIGLRSPVPSGWALWSFAIVQGMSLFDPFFICWVLLVAVPPVSPTISSSPFAAAMRRLFPFPLYVPCHRLGGESGNSIGMSYPAAYPLGNLHGCSGAPWSLLPYNTGEGVLQGTLLVSGSGLKGKVTFFPGPGPRFPVGVALQSLG